MNEKTSVRLSGRVWFTALFFGLVGQVAWIVENMYFATFAQDVFRNSGRPDLSYIVTTLMVILSAIVATFTTIVAGNASDNIGKRKPFIAYGYIIWGLTIMLFALIPMKVGLAGVILCAILLVVFDCVMTCAGSTANDAAFNAWVADNTDPSNRGRLNSVLAILPVIAVVIVFIGLGGFYDSTAQSNRSFFLLIGLIPLVSGLLAFPAVRDSETITRVNASMGSLLDGFRPSFIRRNGAMYVCLLTVCLIGIAQQTFFSYLINFLQITLGLGDGFVIPMAVIIVGSAVVTGVLGVYFDKLGRKRFYFPLLIVMLVGILSFYLIQFIPGALKTPVLYVGGVLMMAGILSLNGALTSRFQDCIPVGSEGRAQGIRMVFMVLIPMIIGPIISLLLGLNAMGSNGSGFAPPYTMFLAAAGVGLLAAIPAAFVRKGEER